jgi:hypothetical protein
MLAFAVRVARVDSDPGANRSGAIELEPLQNSKGTAASGIRSGATKLDLLRMTDSSRSTSPSPMSLRSVSPALAAGVAWVDNVPALTGSRAMPLDPLKVSRMDDVLGEARSGASLNLPRELHGYEDVFDSDPLVMQERVAGVARAIELKDGAEPPF